jgi:UDP-3-O-[3-hydroxymyristoyl] N-acetylglucosamine deacetylase
VNLAAETQRTLAAEARVCGVGVHSGAPANLRIRPAPAGSGIRFVRTDVDLAEADREIAARVECVSDTRLATVLRNGAGVTVSTVEHLMAAFAGLGVDNAIVEIDGPETPVMDGSAAEFVAAIDGVGLAAQSAPRTFIEILEPVSHIEPTRRVELLPASRFEMAVEIIFDAPAIGRQAIELAVEPRSFRSELADARTFGFMSEVEQLRAAGLGRGASLDNTIVVEHDRILNPTGLRRPDEFVRHKALDALGDLALLGAPILGRYEASCGGHALNNLLARALLARPSAWRRVVAREQTTHSA